MSQVDVNGDPRYYADPTDDPRGRRIVDADDGIIAYAVSDDHADAIVRALNAEPS